MIISACRLLRNAEKRFEGEESAAILDVRDPYITPTGPIRYDFVAQWAEGDVIIRGSLSMSASALCARCGDRFDLVVSVAPFLRTMRPEPNTDSIDLTADMREDILLAFPSVARCSDSCQGLCPVCGANLNRTKCRCRPAGQSTEWGKLDGLKLK